VRRLSLVLVLSGCPWTAPVPIAHVLHGPTYRDPAITLAALPVVCSAEEDLCLPAHSAAVANATRMTLELAGYSIVDSELINAEMQRRSTHSQTTETPPPAATVPRNEFHPPDDPTHVEAEVSGGTWWSETSPAAQQAMLAALGVDAVLQTRITVGNASGMAMQRTITVDVTVSRLDARLVWHADCGVETGDYHSTEQAIDLATRCALESQALWP
jgi:hypothetical protein